jgi:hypothetical protein
MKLHFQCTQSMKLSFISEHQKQTANPDMLEQGEEKGNE